MPVVKKDILGKQIFYIFRLYYLVAHNHNEEMKLHHDIISVLSSWLKKVQYSIFIPFSTA